MSCAGVPAEVLAVHARSPHAVEVPTDPVADFLVHACLVYGGDGPHRWARAGAIRAERPDLAAASAAAAAALGDAAAVRAHLDRDPGSARRGARTVRSRGSRCSTSPTPASRRTTRSPRPGCCWTQAPTRTRATCGKGSRPRSPR